MRDEKMIERNMAIKQSLIEAADKANGYFDCKRAHVFYSYSPHVYLFEAVIYVDGWETGADPNERYGFYLGEEIVKSEYYNCMATMARICEKRLREEAVGHEGIEAAKAAS